MLHEQWEIQFGSRTLHVFWGSGHHVIRRSDADPRACLFHFHTSRFITGGTRACIRHLPFFKLLNDFDSRKVLIGRAIAKVKEEVVLAAVNQVLHLPDGVDLAGQGGHGPGGFGHEGTRIARPVVLGKRVCIQILGGQQANAHDRGLKDTSSRPIKSKRE